MKREKRRKNMMKKISSIEVLYGAKFNIAILFFLLISCTSSRIEMRGNALDCFNKGLIQQVEESYEKEYGHPPKSILLVKSDFLLDRCEGLIYFSSSLKSSNVYHKLLYFDSKLYVNYKNEDWSPSNIEGLQKFLLVAKEKYNESQVVQIEKDYLKGTELKGIGR